MSTEHEVTASIGLETSVSSAKTDDIVFPYISQIQLAYEDIKEGFQKWPIWLMLAYQDIKLRYRRSILGPFWLTISMAITVYSMGFLYSRLFHQDLSHYFPFLVSGMLSWSLISTIVLDLTDGLSSSDAYIKQIKLPYSLYIHRIIARNILIFFHNMLVMVPVMVLYHDTAKINMNTLFLIPGLFIIYINGILYGLIFAMIGARYRDISQIIKSLVQVIFFVTPVMWGPEILDMKYRLIVNLNPFYSFIQLIREPLLGACITIDNLIVAAIVTIIGFIISAFLFTRYRARIVYWL